MEPRLCLGLLLEVEALSHSSGTWQVYFWEYEEGAGGGRKCLNSITVGHIIFQPKELPVAVNTDWTELATESELATFSHAVLELSSTGDGALVNLPFQGKKYLEGEHLYSTRSSWFCLVLTPHISLENTSLTALCILFPYLGGCDWSHAPSFLTNKPQIQFSLEVLTGWKVVWRVKILKCDVKWEDGDKILVILIPPAQGKTQQINRNHQKTVWKELQKVEEWQLFSLKSSFLLCSIVEELQLTGAPGGCIPVPHSLEDIISICV